MRRHRSRILPPPPIVPGAYYLNDASSLNGNHYPAGSIIFIKRGSVTAGPLIFTSSGTAQAPIFIAAYGIGRAPVINGSTNSADTNFPYIDALQVTGSYIYIDGLNCGNTIHGGIQVPGYSQTNIFITNCEMSNCGQGVGLNSTNSYMRYCYVHDLILIKNNGNQADYGANGVVIGNGGIEVAYNTFLRCKAVSAYYGYDGGCVEISIHGTVSGISVHDNWGQDSEGFSEIGGAFGATDNVMQNVLFYNNVSLNNGGFLTCHNGPNGSGQNGQPNPSYGSAYSNFQAYFNTIVEEAAPTGVKIVILEASNYVGLADCFHHNIAVLSGGDSIYKWDDNGNGYQHDNCLFLLNRNSSGVPHVYNSYNMALGPGEIIANPMFLNQAGRDFVLQAGSPAAGMGAY